MAIGDKVGVRLHGHLWPGVILAIFTNRAGETRVVVECTAPDVAGKLHIYHPAQLEDVHEK